MSSSCAYDTSRGLVSPPRSMIALLLRSRSRTIRSPRLVKGGIATLTSSWPGLTRPSRLGRQGRALLIEIAGSSPAMTSGKTFALSLRRRRRRGEIGAAPARDQLAVLVEHLRLGRRELPAEPHDLAARGEVARHRRRVIVDAHFDGGHAPAGAADHGPVGSEIDQCRKDAAMGVAPVRVDLPFLAPRRGELDAIVVHRDDLDAEPLMERAARDQRLDLFGS